ncbi:MAG: amidohydrolase [Rhodothermaceae bacterium]|nr:MAG: amidohydrolase [Rhodothermaceae bacterium]
MRNVGLLVLLLLWPSVALAQEQPVVFRGATLYPISGPPIEQGVLVVRQGRIVAVGPEGAVDLPDGAVVHDVTGKVIMPGLVDTHSHVGRVEGGDRSAPLHPAVRTLDAIDVRHSSVHRARAGGITTVNVMSGSGHLLSGQTAYLKLRKGDTVEDLLYCRDPLREVCGGLKMANGTNPQGDPPFPGTRARAAALVRQQFAKALAYRRKVEQAAGDSTKMPERDLDMEALLDVLDGRRVVHFHTHRHDDILTVLRLRREFGFRVVLHHVSEAWKVADEIAAAGVPASIIVLDAPGGKQEASEIRMENGAVLENAGVDVAFHTDDLITDSRWFLRSAALGVRAGMSAAKALEALTLAGARMLDLADRVGSLEPGKDADFILLSGDPLSVYTHVEQTWVEGQKVFDRADPEDRPYAVGGADVFDDGDTFVHDH